MQNVPGHPEIKKKPIFFYGWVIVLLAFITSSTYGLFYSYGLFVEPLQADLHSSKAAISIVYTIYMVVYSICSIPMGFLCDRYGPVKVLGISSVLIGLGVSLSGLATSIWQLYLFFGFVAAVGHGAIYVVPNSTIGRWFIGKRGLATGISNAGLGIGLLVVPPVTSQLIERYGWQISFVILGITFFAINLIVAIFMKADPQSSGLEPLPETTKRPLPLSKPALIYNFSTLEAVKSKAFILLYVISLFGFAAEQMVLVHVVSYSAGVGISPVKASLGISFLGAGVLAGRLLGGEMSDRVGRVFTLALFCAIEAVAIFSLLAIQGETTLYLSMLTLGLGYGGAPVVSVVMLADYYGPKNLGSITGVWISRGAPAGFVGPLMGGIAYDLTGSYWWALMLAGVLCVVTVLLAALIRRPKPSRPLDSPKLAG